MNKPILLLLGMLISFSSFSQTNFWRIEVEGGEELLLTMIKNPEYQSFEAYTRKDALKDLAGTFTYLAAKAVGKVKFPELVHSFGRFFVISDTTYYTGSFDYLDKSYLLTVKTAKNSFIGKITDNKKKIHPLAGDKLETDKPLKNYPAMIANALSMTEKYYFDPGLSSSAEWQNFKTKVNDLKFRIADDWELAANFYWYGKKLPMPYKIEKTEKDLSEPQKKKTYFLKEVKPKTGLIELASLPEEPAAMDQLFRDIQKKDYANLVIDARGKNSPQLSAAILFANHLTNRSGFWGFYLTRKWADTNNSVPKQADYERVLKNFNTLQNKTNQLYQEPGFYLKTEPALPTFKGKIYVLIDSQTSKVSEAMSIWLKSEKIATIVGHKSAGLPMLTETLTIEKQYLLSLQTAQFYDKEGKNYFNQGIEPDSQVTGDDALSFLLKKIN